jgi:O-acetyl-ADP-ribose deacetylase
MELLASRRLRSRPLAAAHQIKSLAFPGISTGIYWYPVELAARIAVATVRSAAELAGGVTEVTFCGLFRRRPRPVPSRAE